MLFGLHGSAVDPELAGLRLAQETLVAALGRQLPVALVALGGGQLVGVGDLLLDLSEQLFADLLIALGYKQLLEIERAWRDMKTTLDLRPVHHRKEDRIRAHVLLCWLALLLIRIAENQAADTWWDLRDELQRMHLGTFTGPAGRSRQRTELTAGQREILRALNVAQPPLFLDLEAPAQASTRQRS